MATRRTWFWIIGITAGVVVIALVVIAGAGVYFISRHISARRVESAEAMRAFDAARSAFKDQRPLIELDPLEQPKLSTRLAELPTSPTKPGDLYILVWDDKDEQLVSISLPFWLLRMGGRKVDLGRRRGFDLEKLNLDMNELERVGPMLILEHRTSSGERVLIWTK
jgi:hypothetical protein